MTGTQLFELIGVFFVIGLLLSVVAIIVGSRRPELVLPKWMHPTPRLCRLIYGVLTLWFFLGAVGFLYLRSIS